MPDRTPNAAPHARTGRPTVTAGKRLGAHILEVASKNFLQHGYEGANMDESATDAQVTKRTLYRRYGSKIGLFGAVIDHERTCFIEALVVQTEGTSVRERISVAAQNILDGFLTPKVIGFDRLKAEIERLVPDYSDNALQIVTSHWVDIIRETLLADPETAKYDNDEIEDIASLLLDTLVLAPRMRIRMLKVLDNTPAAKSAHIDQALDLLAAGIPSLRR